MQPSETFTHEYHGYWTPGARCDVAIYDLDGLSGAVRPVLVLTERLDNSNTSITNLIEQVAAEVCSARWPELLRAWTPGQRSPIAVIEHYPADPDHPYDDMLGVDRYAVVDFASWNVGRRIRSGRETLSLREASWRHVSADQLVADYGIEPPRSPAPRRPCVEAER